MPVQHILEPVLDDDDGRAGLPLDLVDELDGLLAGRRVEVGQRLVEEQHVHVVDEDARERHALLLPAGELARRVMEMIPHADERGGLFDPLMQLRLAHAVVLRREGDILRHREPDELAVRVLQHRADRAGDLEDPQLAALAPGDRQTAAAFPLVGKGDQAVDAVRQRGLAAAGGPADQDLFALADLEVDIVQGRLALRVVLKGKMMKLYDRIVHTKLQGLKAGRCAGTCPIFPFAYFSSLRLPFLGLAAE